jgi:hypothetical protein
VLDALRSYVKKSSTQSLEATLSIRCLRRLETLQFESVDHALFLNSAKTAERHNRALKIETEAWMECRGLPTTNKSNRIIHRVYARK